MTLNPLQLQLGPLPSPRSYTTPSPISTSPSSSFSSLHHNPVAVRFLLECPAKVSYDFTAQGYVFSEIVTILTQRANGINRLCVITLQLHIANCSNHTALSFDLITLSPQEGEEGEGEREEHLTPSHAHAHAHAQAQGHQKKASASQYLWCGTTTHHVDSVAPQATTVLTLSACFFKPGVYNLTRYVLTFIYYLFLLLFIDYHFNRFKLVTQVNNTNTTIYAPFQHLITVEQELI